MNIKILNSWLREYVETDASIEKLAECLSLTSVAVEKIEKFGQNDYTLDIEVTTNRVDLMSVIGLARETAAILPRFNIHATFKKPIFKSVKKTVETSPLLEIHNDPSLVNRICAVVLSVEQKPSPQFIQDRLISSNIRALNNLVDVTNYIMRLTGHPAHVFDYDRLTTRKLIIREAKRDEKITTLDGKEYALKGGDIVADDGRGTIVDLLGVMGLKNSAVTSSTKRIVLFINNNDPTRIRRTSMTNAIRTDAAVLNEKRIDPEAAMDALLAGIKLYKEYANAKVISDVIDIYPNKPVLPTVSVTEDKIEKVIGVYIPIQEAADMLNSLGIRVHIEGKIIHASIPSYRAADITIPEDLVEEVARVYGYHRLPSILPPSNTQEAISIDSNPFYWIQRIKQALKYWGFFESYRYSLVSEDLYEGPSELAVKLSNPLSSDMVYLRRTLVPSLLNVLHTNKGESTLKLFEIANVYEKKTKSLPEEKSRLAFVIKSPKAQFLEAKGVIEQLLYDLNIQNVSFKRNATGNGALILIDKKNAGNVEILDETTVTAEIAMDVLLEKANRKKTFTPLFPYPVLVEDLRFAFPEKVEHAKIVDLIRKQSDLIYSIELLDVYDNKRTYRILYRNKNRNLTNDDISPIREKIIKAVSTSLKAHLS